MATGRLQNAREDKGEDELIIFEEKVSVTS